MNNNITTKKAFLLLACIWFIITFSIIQTTYAKYVTNLNANTNISISYWNILVNKQDIVENSDISGSMSCVFPGSTYAKSDVIVIGFYNPYQYLNTYKSDIDYYIKKLNSLVLEICKKHNVKFIDLYNVFNDKLEYLPNPNSIYPTELGYREIFNIVKNSIN